MSKLFEELKRRKVVRVAGVYAVVAWLLIPIPRTHLVIRFLPTDLKKDPAGEQEATHAVSGPTALAHRLL